MRCQDRTKGAAQIGAGGSGAAALTQKCPTCGWFLSNVKAHTIFEEFGDIAIKKVTGDCKRCGTVEPTNWDFEDFFPDGESFMTYIEEAKNA
jgi:hypothetical protein